MVELGSESDAGSELDLAQQSISNKHMPHLAQDNNNMSDNACGAPCGPHKHIFTNFSDIDAYIPRDNNIALRNIFDIVGATGKFAFQGGSPVA